MKLSELNPSARRRIMVYGDVGTGKTVFAASFPGRKYFADFDGKVSSAASYYGADKARIDEIEYESYKIDKPFDRFTQWLSALAKDPSKPLPFDVFIIDSLTEMISAAIQDFMAKNSAIQRTRTSAGSIPSMLDYRALEMVTRGIFASILSMPCHVIVTAHVRTKQDETTGRIFTGPEGPASVVKHLQVIFEEVYRSYTDGTGDKRRYLAQTQSDGQYPARSQIRGLPAIIDLSYESLKRFGA